MVTSVVRFGSAAHVQAPQAIGDAEKHPVVPHHPFLESVAPADAVLSASPTWMLGTQKLKLSQMAPRASAVHLF